MKFSEMPYERVDFDKIKVSFESLMKELDEAKSAEEQFEVHKKFYAVSDEVSTAMNIAMIRCDGDMTDEFYKAEQDYYDANMPVYQSLVVEYQKKLYQSPYRSELEKIIGAVAFTNIELSMKAMDEKLIPLMQEENALTTKYNMILATAKIDFDGEEKNLSLMRPYLTASDRDVRKAAWEKYTAFFAEHGDEFDEIYDGLVKNRTAQAKAMGYENYLELGYARMMRNNWDKDMAAAFRKQIKEVLVPYAEELSEKRREDLGLASLSYIDENVFFKNGNPKPVGTPEEILEAGRRMYGELSPETAAFMNFMCDNELFDVFGRKTKKTGGYMTYIPKYYSPFIFANFNGTSGDADVITHECGHAFQGFLTAHDPIREHADITMETAETHSMSMEFFTEPWMELLFGDGAEDYRKMHLMDAVLFLPYGTMVDEFQHIVYENPDLTPAERNAAWRELEKTYEPHVTYEGNDFFEAGHFWQKQHHIYDSPLYYLDYCIAGVNALQFRNRMKEDFKTAFADYVKFCKLSASDYFTEMMKEVGLDNPFEEGTLEKIVAGLRNSAEF